MILRLAATPYRYPAKREADAIELVGLTPTTFWARVHRLIERPDVVAAYPVEVGRLRRVRERRASARCA
jgi:hypothetical protein